MTQADDDREELEMSGTTIGATLLTNLYQRVEEKIAAHRQWYFLQAITCVLAGLVAMIVPATTALGFNTVVGSVLVAIGVMKAFTSFKSHIHWWSFVSAAVSIVVGCLMLWQPLSGVIAAATLVAVFLFVEGLTEVFLAFEFESAPNWGWLSLAGIVSVVLSAVLFFGWPGMTMAMFGVMVGANLVLYGAALFALSAAIPVYETL